MDGEVGRALGEQTGPKGGVDHMRNPVGILSPRRGCRERELAVGWMDGEDGLARVRVLG